MHTLDLDALTCTIHLLTDIPAALSDIRRNTAGPRNPTRIELIWPEKNLYGEVQAAYPTRTTNSRRLWRGDNKVLATNPLNGTERVEFQVYRSPDNASEFEVAYLPGYFVYDRQQGDLFVSAQMLAERSNLARVIFNTSAKVPARLADYTGPMIKDYIAHFTLVHPSTEARTQFFTPKVAPQEPIDAAACLSDIMDSRKAILLARKLKK